MNILITVDDGSIRKLLVEYENYKLNFEGNWLKKLDDEYRCYE